MKYLVTVIAASIIALPLYAVDYYATDGTTLLTSGEVAALVMPTWKLAGGKIVLRTAAEETAAARTVTNAKTEANAAVKGKTGTSIKDSL